MNTLLTHPYNSLKIHFHPVSATDKPRPETKLLRRIFEWAEKGTKIAFLITIPYLAILTVVKLVEAGARNAQYFEHIRYSTGGKVAGFFISNGF